MKSSFLHAKEDHKKMICKTMLLLLPLLCYGIYKNGFLLYQRHSISLLEVFKPLWLVFLSFLINSLIKIVFVKKLEFDFSYLYVFLVSLFVMPNVNYFVFIFFLTAGLLLLHFLGKGLTINKVAFLHLLIALGMFLIDKYNYANVAELNNVYSLTLTDILSGRAVGGICTSSFLLGILLLALLSFGTIYKTNVFFIAYAFYCLFNFLFVFVFSWCDYMMFFSPTVVLGFILVGTICESSPYTFLGSSLYASFVGALTAILSLFLPYDGMFVAILLVSVATPLFDKIDRKKRKVL